MCLGAAELLRARRWLACVLRAADLARLSAAWLPALRATPGKRLGGGVSLRQPGFLLPSTGLGVFVFPARMGALGFGPRSNTALACGAARVMPGWGRHLLEISLRRAPASPLGCGAANLPCGETCAGPEEKQRPERWLRAG